MKKLGILLTISILSGCATAPLDFTYAPTEAPTKLAPARMPKLLFRGVENHSGLASELNYNYGNGRTNIPIARPLPDALEEAVRTEMARLGVPLVSSRDQADAVFKAAVTTITGNSPGMLINAVIGFDLEIRSLSGDLLWSKQVSGRASTKFSPYGKVVNETMNKALTDALRNMGRALYADEALDLVFGAQTKTAAAPAAAPTAGAADEAGPRSDVDDLPPAGAQDSHSYAVIIGIEHYREKLPAADFAVGDARLMARYAQRVFGVPERNIALLTGDHATRGDFEKYFERWLPNHVQVGDTVYVYYSGHGAPSPSKGDSYLVPYDGDPTYIEETGYSVHKLYVTLGKLPAKRIVVAMDSCFSGAGGRSVIANGVRPLMTVVTESVPANITVIAASAGNQVSNSFREKGHGLFTYFFAKGLKEHGADLRAVFDYLRPEVSGAARRDLNADQDPQWQSGR